ncbi:B3 domain-containing transcription repressor VAL1-like isoform X2 [Abrus precatorius]|uniref:B3 domain-containing transcription repressor VAL1-like isoform X2 n=1 Tax=Abrus precatorius TaxID=3816 RepID=A0A8B8JGX8_ABRPR|nr:B3 domain-containing transcription repressor VAL1-like isoform X2 [Abrus precatorius]
MGIEVCMNGSCKNGSASEWKKGWPLRSGGFARLCNKCGSAYENSIFCYKFHDHQTGWRECSYCNKPIHCGCIISRSLFEYLDFGGIGCLTCVKASQLPLIQDTENTNRSVRSIKNNASDRNAERIDGRLLVDGAGEGKLMQLCRIAEASESSHWSRPQRDGVDSCIGPTRQEDRRFSNVMKVSSHPLAFTSLENNKPTWETKKIVEGRIQGKASSSPLHQGQGSQSVLSKSSKSEITAILEPNKGIISQERIARPPADGKGKNLLLSRYWPRITDQELEQLSGDLKSTIVPLFEKVLSASDAGRIGRLVLPKSCAEAYFPPISQSEGIPLQIQDVKGNEWTFQFRFWPNNNSRMYVLEGVTPCIQSLQLNAGDTVTFSRIDPGGKFIMGFRRASNLIDTQDASISSHSNGISTKETTFSGATKILPSGCSFPDLLQSGKGNGEFYINGHPEHLHLGTRTADSLQTENCEMDNNNLLQQPISVSEKKTRNIGPKSKRLLIHNEDAVELRLTWEEAQDLLRPPPTVKPSIVTIEDQVFEEYDEPPVFGKRTIFNVQSSGSLHAAGEETSPKEMDNILRTSEDFKKRRIVEKSASIQEHNPSGLDALASAAVLGDDHVDPPEPSAGVTTKHPRHRPGCSCIVCIQPPSGKGKHKPTCTCLACMTVKRRFNTLMTRKRKRQLECEADATPEDHIHHRDETDTNGASRDDTSVLEKEVSLNRGGVEVDEPSAGQIDLNCHPNHGKMQVDITAGLSMTSHVETTNFPAREYMSQNGLKL